MTAEEIALRALWEEMRDDGSIDQYEYNGEKERFVRNIMEIFRPIK